ncbi:MAG: HD domain-containing protein [Proteobacteria bacterium]|nr:HD domain-containing protein [Pseudomonadota bacterium]
MKRREKLFRDPVHNVIHFDMDDEVDRMLFSLIDTDVVQRLRRVCQLGLAGFVYHGAEHSRFGHSLGTQHVACRIFDSACPSGDPFERAVTRAAALLHDVGHAAFSHAFESGISSICRFDHEAMTCAHIMREDGEVFHILHDFDPRMPECVVQCIAQETHAWYHPIISSQLDADRMDYILRDGYMTGIKNYLFDIERILEMLDCDCDGIIVGYRAIHAVETYLISRYHMYSQVYHHKTVRGAEKLLEAIFRRVADLAASGDSSVFEVGRMGMLFKDIVSNRRVDPKLCLSVHDAHAWAAIDLWKDSKDRILSELASQLLSRQFFKTFEIPDVYLPVLRAHWSSLEDVLRARGYDPRYYLALDTTVNRAFAPYTPERAPLLPFVEVQHTGHVNADIRIRQPSGEVVSIQDASPIVDMLTRINTQVARLCVPAAVRDEVYAALKAMRIPV